MSTATNIDANAVNTIGWMSQTQATIVIPVYQRQYRWDIGGCEQLLADIRAVADSDVRHMHFIGSILSSLTEHPDSPELVLIDGQQRITTLMLLIAALHHTIAPFDGDLAGELERVLVRHGDPSRTKLLPHPAWAEVFEDVVLDRRAAEGSARDSRFDDNYAFFRSQISRDEAPRIWAGLQKLEHVAITLGPGADAQQIFESLNSTGEPLKDHELIHNYVLMGLSHAEQREIEESFWLPIEQNTGEAIAGFWRHYLMMRSGREIPLGTDHATYEAFRREFPRLTLAELREHAAAWREYSGIYRLLLDPSAEEDPELSRRLGQVTTFGRAMFPLLLRAYHDADTGVTDAATLTETIDLLQAMLLRRTVVGLSNDRLVARLCRARDEGIDVLVRAVARITPSDERVRVALKFGELPHARYVLDRLRSAQYDDGNSAAVADLEVDHVLPLVPADDWTGDGVRRWADYTDDEQNSHRALVGTLGNLALLESALAERAFDMSFPAKRDAVYRRSVVAATRELGDASTWDTAAIAARTAALTAQFVRVWARPPVIGIDDDGLTPILDAVHRRGWPRGWEREFEYVEYRGEHWEIYDIRSLFTRVFLRLWADAREAVVAYSARRSGPIYPERAWNGHWESLDGGQHLYLGWDAKYMLTAVQGVLGEAGIAPEVFVKYSYRAAHM